MPRYYVKTASSPEEYEKEVSQIQEGNYEISMIQFVPPGMWVITYYESLGHSVTRLHNRMTPDKNN